MSIWAKLNVLVPEPKCKTEYGQITEWYDARPQPTKEEIDAVTDQQVSDSRTDKEADDSMEGTKFNRFLFEALYKINEDIRGLKGQNSITKNQFKDALKTIYKNL